MDGRLGQGRAPAVASELIDRGRQQFFDGPLEIDDVLVLDSMARGHELQFGGEGDHIQPGEDLTQGFLVEPGLACSHQ